MSAGSNCKDLKKLPNKHQRRLPRLGKFLLILVLRDFKCGRKESCLSKPTPKILSSGTNRMWQPSKLIMRFRFFKAWPLVISKQEHFGKFNLIQWLCVDPYMIWRDSLPVSSDCLQDEPANTIKGLTRSGTYFWRTTSSVCWRAVWNGSMNATPRGIRSLRPSRVRRQLARPGTRWEGH